MMTSHDELATLANLYCDEQLDEQQFARLQELLRINPEGRILFIELVQLHGNLNWNGGVTPGHHFDSVDCELDEFAGRELPAPAAQPLKTPPGSRSPVNQRHSVTRSATVAALCLVMLLAIGYAFRNAPSNVEISQSGRDAVLSSEGGDLVPQEKTEVVKDSAPLVPLRLDGIRNDQVVANPDAGIVSVVALPSTSLNDADIVTEIDRLIRLGWTENNVLPAPEAGDHEWIRRTYLTLTGRIPSIQQVAMFVNSDSPRKRDSMVEQLLESSQTSENLAVCWTNLLIGRSNPRGVDEESLYDFLTEQFSANRPWMETVGQLIAADGRSDENGATNFLLAHLNDQATPATAVTARLFLGQQVQCTQCHDHPIEKERGQQEFWGLNAFFKQAERRQLPITDTAGTRKQVWTLSDTGKPGMTFYDTLRGQKKAVLPEFAGQHLEEDTSSRRAELVRILKSDPQHQVAKAMINRTWAQFFGYGFTQPIDDLGLHNPISHPELFDYLADAFVQSNYDLRRLMRWLSLSEAFRLSSVQTDAAVALDDPQEGGTPLFSRAYPRQMGPEQVYDSIRIAIRSVSEQPIDSSVGTAHRREWVEQFVRSYGTDENDEQLTFDGNISQALLMMNGQELQNAIPLAAGEVAKSLREGTVNEAPTRLAMATLNREATENEEKAFRNRYRSLVRSLPPETAMKTATEDMLWAYLNSSEFVSVH